MNLVVDYGNTTAKVAIFNQQQLLEKHTFISLESLRGFIEQVDFENFIVSSVNADADLIISWAVKATQKFILSYSLPLPINIVYSTPHTLGVDRIAGACGAVQLFPKQNTLVIDAGTCITYDLTDHQRNYLGGGISPGLTMRFEALNTFTAKLPLVKPKNNPPLVGTSTEASIQSGVINGVTTEMDGIIELYNQKYRELRVILCGGDGPFFENSLKASIFASPDLVLVGLNSVLIHNVRI